jgi:hypothetical protein
MEYLVKYYNLDPNTNKGRIALAEVWLAKSIKKDSLPAQVWQKKIYQMITEYPLKKAPLGFKFLCGKRMLIRCLQSFGLDGGSIGDLL